VTAGLLFALMIAWSGHDDVLIGVAGCPACCDARPGHHHRSPAATPVSAGPSQGRLATAQACQSRCPRNTAAAGVCESQRPSEAEQLLDTTGGTDESWLSTTSWTKISSLIHRCRPSAPRTRPSSTASTQTMLARHEPPPDVQYRGEFVGRGEAGGPDCARCAGDGEPGDGCSERRPR
jgi:hypothetical protein